MKIQDLFESMASTALDQLINNTNKMAVLYLDTLPAIVRNMYAEGYHEDMLRTTKKVVGQQKGRWFAENFLSTSSRRDRPTAGMKNALLTLAKEPKFASLRGQIDSLGRLEIYASSEQRSEKEASFGSHMTQLESLPHLLKAMGQKVPAYSEKLKICATRLQNAMDSFYSTWTSLHKRWDEEWGKTADTNAQKEEKQRTKVATQQATGTQNSQADQIISQVLNSLDKKTAHEIRQAISRSDNKLMALQQELSKRKIKV